ncbi:dihydroorotase [Thermostichus vulcanus]|uniref:Dihydroorotase n=1 Tax=Thermostichus vulcanus str. 'Rupite' TaxID=2813851 RepID=A0ABT0CC21_THEVL|nr:dihydroorotase [Thermostichus vulcanus]MCJ2543305.1 dihydroorotase [Thermostichus vulcanus str. 'Rupite']
MSDDLLIRNAELLVPEGDPWRGDVWVRQGIIAQMDRSIAPEGITQVIEAEGKTLMPGVIDPQVHFREPGREHKEDLQTGSWACARGGVTSFLEMPNTDPLTINQAALDDKLARAASKCVVNYGFFIGATVDNLKDLQTVQGACGIKIFMGSMHGPLLVDDQAALERIFAETDPKFLIAVHAEDLTRIRARQAIFAGQTDVAIHSQIQDEESALIASQRALDLSTRYQHRLHILHLSTGLEVELLRQHKPTWVTAEVTPQHLLLSTADYARLGSLVQMNPPLRDPSNNEQLWQGLRDGILDCIATDHAPHTLEEKAQPYPQSPSGMPGVETALPLMLTAAQQGRCTLAQVVQWMCEAPARLYGIPNKGRLQVGYDADLVLVDLHTPQPVRREEVLSKCGWSPFEGWELVGWPQVTVVGGQIAFREGKVDPMVRGRALQFQR